MFILLGNLNLSVAATMLDLYNTMDSHNFFLCLHTATTSSLNIDIDVTDDSLALPGFCQSLETVLRQGLKGEKWLLVVCFPASNV